GSNTIGLIVEFLRPDFMPFAKGFSFNNLGVQGSNAVDGISRIRGNPRHVHMTVGHRRHVLNTLVVEATLRHIFTETTIDFCNKLPYSPKQRLEDRYFPGL